MAQSWGPASALNILPFLNIETYYASLHRPWLHIAAISLHRDGMQFERSRTGNKKGGPLLLGPDCSVFLVCLASPAGLLVALALLCSRCFGPVRPPPGTVRSDRSFLLPFSAQLTQKKTMDGPALLSLVSQASHAAAAGRPPDLPQRSASSLVDSGLGVVGG